MKDRSMTLVNESQGALEVDADGDLNKRMLVVGRPCLLYLPWVEREFVNQS